MRIFALLIANQIDFGMPNNVSDNTSSGCNLQIANVMSYLHLKRIPTHQTSL